LIASAVENMSNFRNLEYEHGINVLNSILFTIDYKFNIRACSSTVSMTLILIQHNSIAELIIVGNSSYRCTYSLYFILSFKMNFENAYKMWAIYHIVKYYSITVCIQDFILYNQLKASVWHLKRHVY